MCGCIVQSKDLHVMYICAYSKSSVCCLGTKLYFSLLSVYEIQSSCHVECSSNTFSWWKWRLVIVLSHVHARGCWLFQAKDQSLTCDSPLLHKNLRREAGEVLLSICNVITHNICCTCITPLLYIHSVYEIQSSHQVECSSNTVWECTHNFFNSL